MTRTPNFMTRGKYVAGQYFRAAILCAVSGAAGCVEQPASPPDLRTAVPAASAIEHDDPEVRQLLDLMRQRLLLMHDVARWKWNKSLPISDPERERDLLDELAEQARSAQLDPEWARRFFEAQIEAGKQIQAANFAAWKAAGQGTFAAVPDLIQVQRPALTRVSRDLVLSLAHLQGRLGTTDLGPQLTRDAERILIGAGIGEATRSTALQPLFNAP